MPNQNSPKRFNNFFFRKKASKAQPDPTNQPSSPNSPTPSSAQNKSTSLKKSKRSKMIERKGKFKDNDKVPDLGAFEEKIVKTLKISKNPLNIEQIAKRTSRTRDFVFVWLVSAGKAIKEIKKVDIGIYQYSHDDSLSLDPPPKQLPNDSSKEPLKQTKKVSTPKKVKGQKKK